MGYLTALALTVLAYSSPLLAGTRLTVDWLMAHGIAIPLTEKKTLYRWQSPNSAESLLRHGQMTPILYNYFMNLQNGIAKGPGLYAAIDPYSSRYYGDRIIEVTLHPGVPLVKRNLITWIKLKAFGLSFDHLNEIEGIAVSYNSNEWFVIRVQSGVTFSEVRNPTEILESQRYLDSNQQRHLWQTLLPEVLNSHKERLEHQGTRPTEMAMLLQNIMYDLKPEAKMLDLGPMPFVNFVGRNSVIANAP